MTARRRAVLIAGPTASGKSALALAMARERDGVIVNADSMQIYDTLQVVTARPSDAETAQAEHRLYGSVPAAQRFSTGQWLQAVGAVIEQVDPARPLIFVGGTGLYFDALLNGFADVPAVPAAVTLQVQQEIQALDAEQRLALLEREDPAAAARLKVVDPQRLIRALAVKRHTGRKLSDFQQASAASMLAYFLLEKLILDPERDVLRQRIAMRFEQMFDGGAVAEVEALRALDLDPALPVMKAIGVREIGDWLDGVLRRDEAIGLATIATQQYAKRQRTWFRNRFADWPRRGS
ncbi:tRNA (adenosine(37)-N6)-dimethylallyltransferase MiaA [Devosia sp. A369]